MTPEITVVIPSRRGPRLAFALEALSEQTLGPERFEVVVVRDPASEDREYRVPGALRLRFEMAEQECGPTVKRNVGWRSTAAPLIAFTDDDCRPAPDWLERLVAADGGPDAFLQGRTEPDPDEEHLLHGLARSQRIEGPSEWYQACNVACPRALLERLGGFDEDFYFGSEDTDLALRALESGARRIYVDALVWHAVIPRTLPVAVREAARWPSQPLVLRRHPQQRAAIYRRYFYKQSHAALLLAAAGAAIALRSPTLGLAAAAPYVGMHLDLSNVTARRIARHLVHLPSRALVDAVEVAATARSAWRYRVLAL